MKGDFSRFGFDLRRSFSRILHQQGRVSLDFDANEQQAINLYLLRTLAADLIGPHGGPADAFKVQPDPSGASQQLVISAGHYYVDGWLCENRDDVAYRANGTIAVQHWLPDARDPDPGQHIAYLEVWERHVSAAEFDPLGNPASPDALREVALGGADTAARAQVVWQVRLAPLNEQERADFHWEEVAGRLLPTRRGMMKAEADKPEPATDDPCHVSPRARYRGIENQLYRIEIATGGKAEGGATFVWSRENGSVTFPVDTIADAKVKLADVWRDTRFGLGIGTIVEIVDQWSGLVQEREFRRVEKYDPDTATVTLDLAPKAQSSSTQGPLLLRRWDHVQRRSKTDSIPEMTPEHTLLLSEGKALAIEEGIVVTFEASGEMPADYRAGDYWLIPARTVLGDILWPRSDAGPEAVEPHGIDRRLAPLALVDIADGGKPAVAKDLRNRIDPIAKPA